MGSEAHTGNSGTCLSLEGPLFSDTAVPLNQVRRTSPTVPLSREMGVSGKSGVHPGAGELELVVFMSSSNQNNSESIKKKKKRQNKL